MIARQKLKIDSKPNEGKSVVAEGFSRSLENKNYKYMTSASKNMYINNLLIQLINTTIHIEQSKWCLLM